MLRRIKNNHYDALQTKIKFHHGKNFKNEFKRSSILKIPYINNSHLHEIKSILHNYDFNILPIFTAAPTLNDTLCRSSFTPKVCNSKGCPLKNNLCFKKNVVYQLNCTRCEDKYIGETKRYLHDRIKEHLKSIELGDCKSALSEHYLKKHPRETSNYFTVRVLKRTTDAADRLISEGILIDKLNPTIDLDKGWRNLKFT